MTREEQAIEYIKGYRKLDEKLYNTAPKGTVSSIATKKCLEFWDMAIKALEQQPCEDVISREAALEKMADYVASGYADSAEDFEEYSRIICQLPSITQKPIVCDDAISCEAVIEWLKAKDIIKLSSQEETARKELKALPPVTPQQKYGKWIVHEKPHGIRYLECPYCNTWYLNEHLIRNSYCPNCGCRMFEPQEREEQTDAT